MNMTLLRFDEVELFSSCHSQITSQNLGENVKNVSSKNEYYNNVQKHKNNN